MQITAETASRLMIDHWQPRSIEGFDRALRNAMRLIVPAGWPDVYVLMREATAKGRRRTVPELRASVPAGSRAAKIYFLQATLGLRHNQTSRGGVT